MSNATILEKVWNNPEERLFRSTRHGVMAAVDAFPKMPYQCVVAPKNGTPGYRSDFNDLPRIEKRKLFEVADVVGTKILSACTEEQRVITHIEGFGINDHAHIVLFAAERKQGADLYGSGSLGAVAVQRTLEAIKFSPADIEELEHSLDQIASNW